MSNFGRGDVTSMATFAVTTLLTVAAVAFSGGSWANKQVMFVDASLQATGTSNFTYTQASDLLEVGYVLADGITGTSGTFTNTTVTNETVTTLTGTTGAFTSSLSAPDLPVAVSSSFLTSSSTFYALQNTTGRTRVLLDLAPIYTATVSVGTFAMTCGTSTTAFPTTTSTSPLFSGMVTTHNSRDVLVSTSTLTLGPAPILNNEFLVCRASTSTNAGVMRLLML